LAITIRGDPDGAGEPRPGNRFETLARLRARGTIKDIINADSKIAAQPSQLLLSWRDFARTNDSQFLTFANHILIPKYVPRQVS